MAASWEARAALCAGGGVMLCVGRIHLCVARQTAHVTLAAGLCAALALGVAGRLVRVFEVDSTRDDESGQFCGLWSGRLGLFEERFVDTDSAHLHQLDAFLLGLLSRATQHGALFDMISTCRRAVYTRK